MYFIYTLFDNIHSSLEFGIFWHCFIPLFYFIISFVCSFVATGVEETEEEDTPKPKPKPKAPKTPAVETSGVHVVL
jgi:hypothetical protein